VRREKPGSSMTGRAGLVRGSLLLLCTGWRAPGRGASGVAVASLAGPAARSPTRAMRTQQRRRAAPPLRRLEERDQVAFRHPIAALDLELLDRAAAGEGTSIVAFSVSSVMSDASSAMTSPASTGTSMTSTSL
jgi:hypothetical protein